MASWLSRLASPLATAFRETVSGSKDGLPEWAKQMAEGDDEGLFGPESAVWEVHGALSTLVGGVRALLLQAAHPAALAGVAEHSRYEDSALATGGGASGHDWRRLAELADRIAAHAPREARVRDVGCGNGGLLDALKARGYDHRYVFSKATTHCDRKVFELTLADTLVWLWRGYHAE